MQSIHKYLFQDVYEWAGKIRLVDIAKSNMFCKVQFIDAQANEIFGNLKFDNFLNGISREEFVGKSAYYFFEINALHPFRDGNVTQRHQLNIGILVHLIIQEMKLLCSMFLRNLLIMEYLKKPLT